MTTSSRPGRGPIHAQSRCFRNAFLFGFLFLLGWSGQAAAVIGGCEIVPNSATSQTGPAGTTLNYTFNIVDTGGCAATVSGVITETSDPSGGFSAPPTWTGTPGTTVSVTINLGPTPGSSASYSVTCPVSCSGTSVQITWTASTYDAFTLTSNGPASSTVLEGMPVTLNATYLRNGVDNDESTIWDATPAGGFFTKANPVFTDGSTGHVDNTFISYTPGNFTITANGDPADCTPVCPPQVSYAVVVEDLALTPLQPPGGTATIGQNSSILLKVQYTGPTLPAPDGTTISWNVSSEPTPGAGAFTGETSGPPSFVSSDTSNGVAQATLNVTIPGTYVISAGYCPDGCNDTTTFTITVVANTADLSVTKTDSPDPVAPGNQLTYTIGVSNAGPDPSQQIVLTDTLPAQLTFVSLGSPPGWRCTTPAPGAGGTITCNHNVMVSGGSASFTLVTSVAPGTTPGSTISNTASVSSLSDPNGANDSATSATLVSSAAPSLSVSKVLTGTSDNDDSGSVSTGDQLDYQVTATNNGNTTLTNVVVSDDHFAATQTCPSLAPAATCVLTGSYIVTAGDTTAGSVTNVGRATSTQVAGPISSSVITPIVVIEPATLAVGSGNNQSTPVNTPFPLPLTVIASGQPPVTLSGLAAAVVAPGVTINWLVVSGSATLGGSSSTTNASGVASMTVTAGPVAGPIVVRASRADNPSVTATFNLTATDNAPSFGDLPGLTPNQQAVADALDGVCTGAPTTGGSTDLVATAPQAVTSQADLLARCQELANAIGDDPAGVILALDQLYSDIALVQSESSLLAAESQFDNIKARIAALRSGTVGTSFGGLALNTASGRLPIGSMFQSLLDEKAPDGTKEIGSDFSRWGFFAAGTFGRGNADAGSLSPSYDFDINGITAGVDYRKSDKLIFGGTLGYTSQTNDLKSREGSLGTTGWSASAYGTWYQQNSWYMDGVLSYGRNSYDIERRVRYTLTTPSGSTTIDQTGHASGNGDSLSFALSVGRDFNKGGFGFGPYLRAMYTKMNFDPMVEQFDPGSPGYGLALSFDTRSVTSMTSTLGGKLTYAHSTSWGVMIPHLQLEWQHEFETDPSQVEARFLFDPAGAPFTIHGDPVDTDFFRFGVGMSFVMTHGRSGFFYYEHLLSRDRFSQDSLALGIRIEF